MERTAQHGSEGSTSTVSPAVASSLVPSATSSSEALTSLAPRYEEQYHGTYLHRLKKAVEGPKNLNIALTGRYGTGKSSVLDQFEEVRKSTTLRLAISTLGPNDEGASLTNRIQKELVKQLVYSASTATLRHSRFRRRSTLPWRRAAIEVTAAIALIWAFLALLGWLPPLAGASPDHHWFVQAGAWIAFAAILLVVGTALRMVTHDKFVVSDVSAGGATVTLSERTPTYFDEYLDDIVNYFDTEDIDIVIFEDIDRFNDPHIFEALRELNTLLNNTKKRSAKGKPLRFVYAVRDSLFERVGADPEAQGGDAAASETVRANRTKFFDVVIPMVPFISHRNARELLTDLLADAGIIGIGRPLVNLVARHSTDMRLLRNMRNEYLVFAERLLESDKVAPGLTPSSLFALVAYKNFHLKDFENISRRTSDLDHLYDLRRELVRNSISTLESRKREIVSGREQVRTRAQLARKLGNRLLAVAELSKNNMGYSAHPRLDFKFDDHEFTSTQVGTYEFWQSAAHTETITVLVSSSAASSGSNLFLLRRSDLAALAPEGLDSDRWREIDADATRSELAAIERDIAFLRGADFGDLATKTKYTLTVTRPVTVLTPSGNVDSLARQASPVLETVEVEQTFAELVEGTMRSDLACELVKRGHLDRNFALYAAQFYGHFTGVDVANFMVQSVQTNTMEVDYEFTSSGAVANLLDEADDDFTHTVSAYNIDVLSHLLDTSDPRAIHVVDHVVTDFDDDARTFLTAYFTSGAQREKLAACLAGRGWRDVFTYLVGDDGVPADARPVLVNAALGAVDLEQDYDLPPEVNGFIVEHYRVMPVFTQPQDDAVTEEVGQMLIRAGILIPNIDAIDDALRTFVVDTNRYLITAPNVRAALESFDTAGRVSDISFDQVHRRDVVYRYCLDNPASYLAAIDHDEATHHTIQSPHILVAVLSDVAEEWEDSQIEHLVNHAAPGSCLSSLRDVPASTWTFVADARLFRASLANIEDYRTEIGSIDRHLAKLLETAGTIYTSDSGDTVDKSGEEFDQEAAAIAILNARTISELATRVALARILVVDPPLPVADISPEPSDLFAQLLEHCLVADDAVSFAHFHRAGWAAIGPAIATSSGIAGFLSADLVHGMVAELLDDAATRDKVGWLVVTEADKFVPDEDAAALNAVALYADNYSIPLTPETVVRVAQVGASDQGCLLRLLWAASPAAGAQHIVDVFTELGSPYSAVRQSGAEFEVAQDYLHEFLLGVLQGNNMCTFRKKRGKDLYSVNVI